MKGPENMCEDTVAKHFTNLEIEQIQKSRKLRETLNTRRNLPRHVTIKMSKIKYRENIKSTRENKQVIYKGYLMTYQQNCRPEGSGMIYNEREIHTTENTQHDSRFLTGKNGLHVGFVSFTLTIASHCFCSLKGYCLYIMAFLREPCPSA